MATAKSIHEAVQQALAASESPCTLDEIISAISSGGLYTFKVDNPRGVVRQAIRRRCQGYLNLDRAGNPLFREVGGGRYALLG